MTPLPADVYGAREHPSPHPDLALSLWGTTVRGGHVVRLVEQSILRFRRTPCTPGPTFVLRPRLVPRRSGGFGAARTRTTGAPHGRRPRRHPPAPPRGTPYGPGERRTGRGGDPAPGCRLGRPGRQGGPLGPPGPRHRPALVAGPAPGRPVRLRHHPGARPRGAQPRRLPRVVRLAAHAPADPRPQGRQCRRLVPGPGLDPAAAVAAQPERDARLAGDGGLPERGAAAPDHEPSAAAGDDDGVLGEPLPRPGPRRRGVHVAQA